MKIIELVTPILRIRSLVSPRPVTPAKFPNEVALTKDANEGYKNWRVQNQIAKMHLIM